MFRRKSLVIMIFLCCLCVIISQHVWNRVFGEEMALKYLLKTSCGLLRRLRLIFLPKDRMFVYFWNMLWVWMKYYGEGDKHVINTINGIENFTHTHISWSPWAHIYTTVCATTCNAYSMKHFKQTPSYSILCKKRWMITTFI